MKNTIIKNEVAEIKEIVDRETQAWDQQDLAKLMSIFHPDMVWPWPRTSQSHDPIDWIFEVGRFNYERWQKGWSELFASHRLVHNKCTANNQLHSFVY
jgi:ketosteroid isomerase-like protein